MCENLEKIRESLDFVCSVCDVRFSEEKQYFGHLRVHKGEISWNCPQCPNLKFDSQLKLKMHENSCHNVIRPFKCDLCDLEFDRASQLAYHRRSLHLGEKSHICQICEKGFFRKTDLKTHLNIHLGTNVCICEVCGRKFNHVSNLIRHCRTHAGIKPYPCTFCGKRFTQISSLVRHKKIHEKEINNEQRTIHFNDNLTATEQREKGILKNVETKKIVKRRHYCKICGENFKFILLLRKHEKEHENVEKNIECQNCKKKFQENESLEDHICEENSWSRKIEPEIQPSTCDSNVEFSLRNHSMENMKHLENIQRNSDLENLSNVKMLETAFCVTSEQLEQITLEKMEDDKILEFMGTMNSLENSNISEILNIYNTETDEFFNTENPKLKSKHKNTIENPKDIIYVQCLQKNDPPQTSRVLETDSLEKDSYVHFLPRNEEIESLENSGMKLVQIETGQQFYELIMNSFSEKLPNESSPKIMEIEESEKDLENQDFEFFRNDNIQQFLEFDQPELEMSKTGENLDCNSLDFLVCVVENDETLKDEGGKVEDVKEGEKVRKKFECTVCEKTFSTGYNFKQHIGTHFSEQQKFHCKECGMSFAWKSTLNKHLSNNHRPEGRQMFACDICPKIYSTLSQVNEHVKRDHLKERNHICPECGKSFFKKFDLKMHSRTHTNERPYICRLCGKGFHHRSHIIRHKRIHSGEKPFSCNVCGKNFSQKGSLNAHKQRHNQEREKLDILSYDLDDGSLSLSTL